MKQNLMTPIMIHDVEGIS